MSLDWNIIRSETESNLDTSLTQRYDVKVVTVNILRHWYKSMTDSVCHVPLKSVSVTLQTEILSTKTSGPGYSKLTTLLVNVSLKFQMHISEICQYFLLKNVRNFFNGKLLSFFSAKNISVFGYEVIKHLTS